MEQLVADKRRFDTAVATPIHQTQAPVDVNAMGHQHNTADGSPSGRCFLLELPADIRNILYELVFSSEQEIITLEFDHDDYQEQYNTQIRSVSALAMTCTKLRSECKHLPVWLNTFRLNVPVMMELSKLPVMKDFHVPPREPQTSDPVVDAANYRKRIAGIQRRQQKFAELNKSLPHVDEFATRLEHFAAQRHITSALRNLHIHLGNEHPSSRQDRFSRALDRVGPIIHALHKDCADIRISFNIKLSTRLPVPYAFSWGDDPDGAVREMDSCVAEAKANMEPEVALDGIPYVEDFSEHELEMHDVVRTKVWQSMYGLYLSYGGEELAVPFKHPFEVPIETEEEHALGMRRSRERSFMACMRWI